MQQPNLEQLMQMCESFINITNFLSLPENTLEGWLRDNVHPPFTKDTYSIIVVLNYLNSLPNWQEQLNERAGLQVQRLDDLNEVEFPRRFINSLMDRDINLIEHITSESPHIPTLISVLIGSVLLLMRMYPVKVENTDVHQAIVYSMKIKYLGLIPIGFIPAISGLQVDSLTHDLLVELAQPFGGYDHLAAGGDIKTIT